MTDAIECKSHSPEQTFRWGAQLGSALRGGEVLALIGPLGAGKTHLVKGIASGLGAADAAQVSSPTFVVVNEYTCPAARFEIYHIDAYRLDHLDEFEMLGFDEFCHPDSVVLVEWADKIMPALAGVDWLTIRLDHAGRTQRNIRIDNPPDYVAEAVH